MEYLGEVIIALLPGLRWCLFLASQSLANSVAKHELEDTAIDSLADSLRQKLLTNAICSIGYATDDFGSFLKKANVKNTRIGQYISAFIINLIVVAVLVSAFQFDLLPRRFVFMLVALVIVIAEIGALRFGKKLVNL